MFVLNPQTLLCLFDIVHHGLCYHNQVEECCSCWRLTMMMNLEVDRKQFFCFRPKPKLCMPNCTETESETETEYSILSKPKPKPEILSRTFSAENTQSYKCYYSSTHAGIFASFLWARDTLTQLEEIWYHQTRPLHVWPYVGKRSTDWLCRC